jgi:hypothetical protein
MDQNEKYGRNEWLPQWEMFSFINALERYLFIYDMWNIKEQTFSAYQENNS